MRPGDYIDFQGHTWTVIFCFAPSRRWPDLFRSGRHIFMAAVEGSGFNCTITYRLEHEDDVRAGWRPGPAFYPAQVISLIDYGDQPLNIHVVASYRGEPRADGELVSLIDPDYTGSFIAMMRWQLAMLEQHGMPISFENAIHDTRGAA